MERAGEEAAGTWQGLPRCAQAVQDSLAVPVLRQHSASAASPCPCCPRVTLPVSLLLMCDSLCPCCPHVTPKAPPGSVLPFWVAGGGTEQDTGRDCHPGMTSPYHCCHRLYIGTCCSYSIWRVTALQQIQYYNYAELVPWKNHMCSEKNDILRKKIMQSKKPALSDLISFYFDRFCNKLLI